MSEREQEKCTVGLRQNCERASSPSSQKPSSDVAPPPSSDSLEMDERVMLLMLKLPTR